MQSKQTRILIKMNNFCHEKSWNKSSLSHGLISTFQTISRISRPENQQITKLVYEFPIAKKLIKLQLR
jgi:hypothetical protein